MRHSFVYDSAAHAFRCRDCDTVIDGVVCNVDLAEAIATSGDCPAPYRRHRLVTLGQGSRCLTCGEHWTGKERREHPPEMSPPWATEPCPTLSPEAVA